MGQETALQALGTPQRLCSSPWELPSRASVLLLRGDVSLQLSEHQPGCLPPALCSMCFLIFLHSLLIPATPPPPVTWNKAFDMSSLSPNQNGEEGRNWQEEEEKHNCDCSSMGLSSPPTPGDYWLPDFLLTISMSFLALTGLMLTPPQPVFSPSLPNPLAFFEALSAWCPSINSPNGLSSCPY